MQAVFVFPHHLFKEVEAMGKNRFIFFIEHPLFFKDHKYEMQFHKQKIILHRASMKHFYHHLKKKGMETLYIEADEIDKEMHLLKSYLTEKKISLVHLFSFDDFILEKRIREFLDNLKIGIEIYPSPGFLLNISDLSLMMEGKSHLFFQNFYIQQRKKFHILLDENLKPEGGKWSFDAANRKKAPKNMIFPHLSKRVHSSEVQEAISYTEKNYPSHVGDSAKFSYPVSHEEAKKHLDEFLQNRLQFFGDYEDAIVQSESVLFHSLLSPLLNIGLITPKEVIEKTVTFATSHNIPLNSLEGFIRQVLGWREFVRGVYHCKGSLQRKRNFFGHKRKMPDSFYKGTTGILPVDVCIKKLHETAYLHHIERLMILGNFFFLCEIDPDEVYKWFMEFFIDAYDWVMVPNVYGMSQYADGGLMTTKPYFSGSNYILKMSNFPKGEWTEIWDGLFWRFMTKHNTFFQKQPRLKILAEMAKKKEKEKVIEKGEKFLSSLQ